MEDPKSLPQGPFRGFKQTHTHKLMHASSKEKAAAAVGVVLLAADRHQHGESMCDRLQASTVDISGKTIA